MEPRPKKQAVSQANSIWSIVVGEFVFLIVAAVLISGGVSWLAVLLLGQLVAGAAAAGSMLVLRRLRDNSSSEPVSQRAGRASSGQRTAERSPHATEGRPGKQG